MGKLAIGAILVSVLFLGCLTPKIKQDLALEYYNIGNIYFAQREYTRAVESYRKALTFHPDLSEGSFNLARVYFELGRYDEGLSILKKLQAEKGENLLLLQTIAYGLAKSGREEEAITYYLRALSLSEGNTHCLYNLGVLYYAREEYEQAYIYLSRLHEIDPQDLETLKLLGQIEVRRERYSEALQYFLPFLAREPGDLEVGFQVYRVLSDQKRYGEALKILEGLLEEKKEDPGVWFEKAYVLLTKAEEKKEGLEALEKALTLGFRDSKRFRTLIAETSPIFLEEVFHIFLRTGALTKEEVEKLQNSLYGLD